MLAFLVPLRPDQKSKTLINGKQPLKIGFIARGTSNATSVVAACCGVGSLPDAHHKTAVSHCVHPVKAYPAHFAFFVHEQPDDLPPRTNPFQ
ncbi:hypothetical protein ACNKHL_06085 [Shigella flexneri]